MTQNEVHPEIFIVVKASRGLPAVAEAFWDESAAEQRAYELQVDINIEYDEIDIFQTVVQ